jgi:hypothetical protein
MTKIMSDQEWIQIVSESATPIDFESLIASGILKRRSKFTYLVLEFKKVPAHVWRQVQEVAVTRVKGNTTNVITVRDKTKAMKKLLVQAVGAQQAEKLIAQVTAKGAIVDK